MEEFAYHYNRLIAVVKKYQQNCVNFLFLYSVYIRSTRLSIYWLLCVLFLCLSVFMFLFSDIFSFSY